MLMHKLALRMGRTVGELGLMTTDEWIRWIAFNNISPIGDERMDYLFARLCLLVSDAVGMTKRGGGHFTFDDFLLFKPKEDETPPIDFMRALFGNRIIKGKPKRRRT